MEQYTDKQILDKYEQLPEDLKESVFSDEMAKIIEKIGKNYNLSDEKTEDLNNESGMVMIGFTHPKDYVSNLSKRLGVIPSEAKKIAQDINIQIFSKVRDSLKKIHGIEDKKISTSDVGEKTSDVSSKAPASPSNLPAVPKPTVLSEKTPIKPNLSASKPLEQQQSPFEVKTKQDVFRMAPKESKYEEKKKEPEKSEVFYPGGQDPYREPIE